MVRGEDSTNVLVTVTPTQPSAGLHVRSSLLDVVSGPQDDLPGLTPCRATPLRIHQLIVTTTEDSVFRTEMVDLESQEENTPKSV